MKVPYCPFCCVWHAGAGKFCPVCSGRLVLR
jgi:hypothetical protein